MAKDKYPGLAAGTYAYRAVSVVMDCGAKRMLEPVLAAQLGLKAEQMGLIKKAVEMGYLSVEQPEGDEWPKGTKMYVPGRKFNAQFAQGKVTAEGLPTIGTFPSRQKDRPLNPAYLPKRHSTREGAWDFLNIPSLYPSLEGTR